MEARYQSHALVEFALEAVPGIFLVTNQEIPSLTGQNYFPVPHSPSLLFVGRQKYIPSVFLSNIANPLSLKYGFIILSIAECHLRFFCCFKACLDQFICCSSWICIFCLLAIIHISHSHPKENSSSPTEFKVRRLWVWHLWWFVFKRMSGRGLSILYVEKYLERFVM